MMKDCPLQNKSVFASTGEMCTAKSSFEEQDGIGKENYNDKFSISKESAIKELSSSLAGSIPS